MDARCRCTAGDVGLLLLRAGVGGALFAHGAQKLFGWFGGGGPEGTAKFMDSMGFDPPELSATLAGLGETGSGVLLTLGLGTGPAAAAAIGTMVSAGATQVSNGFFNSAGGFELPAVYALAVSALALTGPGHLSLDHVTRHVLSGRGLTRLAYVGVLGGAAYTLWRRQRTLARRAADQATDPDDDATA